MSFDEYVSFLWRADAIVMHSMRPQGYGNIFMMMYMEKPVFMNEKNISVSDLNENGMTWHSLTDLKNIKSLERSSNRQAVVDLLSHEKLMGIYKELFS